MSKQVVIYGASGYTGKLISWHMAELGIPFIAAGRSLSRLEEQMSLKFTVSSLTAPGPPGAKNAAGTFSRRCFAAFE